MPSINEAIKTPQFKSNRHKAVVNIMYTANVINNYLDSTFKPFDVSKQQYNVLRILRGKYPSATTCGYLKDVMLERNPDITRLCNRLIAKELLARNNNPSNKRSMQIKITQKGLDLLEKMDPIIDIQAASATLTEEEAETLSILLDKVRG
jgi:DNA-binding MarR family transcriptional regulator